MPVLYLIKVSPYFPVGSHTTLIFLLFWEVKYSFVCLNMFLSNRALHFS